MSKTRLPHPFSRHSTGLDPEDARSSEDAPCAHMGSMGHISVSFLPWMASFSQTQTCGDPVPALCPGGKAAVYSPMFTLAPRCSYPFLFDRKLTSFW